MKEKLKILTTVFFVFLKVSPVTFGGGYAMLSLIQIEVVNKRQWVKEKDLLDIFAISQSIPGAVAINSAIFVGYQVARFLGSLAALLGIIFPTLILVIIVSHTYYYFQDNQIINSLLSGVGLAIIALILHAGYTIARTAIINYSTGIIAILSISILFLFSINPIWIIMGGLFIGILIGKLKKHNES